MNGLINGANINLGHPSATLFHCIVPLLKNFQNETPGVICFYKKKELSMLYQKIYLGLVPALVLNGLVILGKSH